LFLTRTGWRPVIGGRERPVNLGVALREAFIAVNDLVLARLAAQGPTAIRAAHGAVFQYLDDAGTTVSLLAERAQMTKQAMAELVVYLEAHGYVTRTPDPDDRRAKLVVPTARGREVIAVAQGARARARGPRHRAPQRGPAPCPARGSRDHPAHRHRRAAPRSRLITDLWPNGPGVTRHCRIRR
jgi:DNA-binding MarR family transcriptional regulator